MNILYITPYVPSPIRVRPYHLIRTLVHHGHHVTLATLWERPGECQALEELRTQGIDVISAPLALKRRSWNSLRALATGVPLQATYCDSPELRCLIAAAYNARPHAFDIVHVEHLRGALYGLLIKSQMRSQQLSIQTPIVWDSVDCISYLFEQTLHRSRSLFSRIIARLELGRTRRHERWLASQFDQLIVTAQPDKGAFESLTELHAPITVLPQGVDLDYFKPQEPSRQVGNVIYSGKMSYHANVTAAVYLATQIMPLVWVQQPSARLVIAGSSPPRSVRSLASKFPGRVQVTGYVPDMCVPLQQATVAAAPLLYGAGIQTKVLEAMACGTPVVATSCSVAALSVRPGADCLVADSTESFAAALLSLLCDNAMRTRLGEAGRRYVEANHDWHAITSRLESIYDALLPLHGEPISLHEPYW